MFLKKNIILSVFFAFSSIIVSQAEGGWNAWIDHSLVKIKQNGYDHANVETKNGAQSLTIKMAKNEFESFQVFIYADGENLTNVDVVVGKPTKGTDTISDIFLYKEWYINCDQHSRPEYTTGYYPDPLLPKVDRYYGETRNAFPFNVTKGNVQGVWVDIGTEAGTTPGTYTSTVTVSADGKTNIKLNLTIEVWDFALPSTSSFGSAIAILDGYLSAGHMGTKYVGSVADALMPLYAKMALYHRISTRTMTRLISRYNWDGTTKKLSNVDFSIFDRYYSDVLNGTAITSGPYAGAKARTAVIPQTGTSARIDNDDNIANEDKSTASIQYQQAYYDHFGAKGWDVTNTLITMAVQEPKDHIITYRGQQMTEYAKARIQVQEANAINTSVFGTGAPFQRVLVASHNVPELADLNCLFNPWVGHYAPASWEKDNPNSSYIYPASGYPATMERQWTYLSCMNNGCVNGIDTRVNGQIDLSADAAPLYNRMMSFYFEKQGVTDFWYFQMNHIYDKDPYYDLWPSTVEGSNGDGTLVYPGVAGEFGGTPAGTHTPNIGGTHDIPIESIRLKYIRDAMEDLEYFKLATESAGKAAVDAIIDTMFTNTNIALCYWNLNKSPDALFTARSRIANLINGNTPSLFITISPPEVK